MKTGGKQIILKFSSETLPVAHTAVITDFMKHTRHRICRACAITPELYDSIHYDLAYDWFEYNKFFEYTARVFLVSKIFHRWWNQQVAQEEDQFLRQWGNQGISTDKMREALFEIIITMEIRPAAEVRRSMHEEGQAILRNNPSLWDIKIYRHG